MKRRSIAALLLMPLCALAAPAQKTQSEIGLLMDALAASDCKFQRNGSWHDAREARKHLQRKYDYLLKKDQVGDTEQFIDRAASRSSISGRAYRVKCAGREQDAATWFGERLRQLRQPSEAAGSGFKSQI
jgi:Family of unknown function (DUF5329)